MDYGPSTSTGGATPYPATTQPTTHRGSVHSLHHPPQDSTHHITPVGIYGWKKRCLYMLLLLLVITVIINVALTIWIIRVMDFNVHGMGKLRIMEHGVKVDGDATFLKSLRAKRIQSLMNSGLNITSHKNVTITSRNKGNSVHATKVYLGDKKFVVYAKRFQVRDKMGKRLFAASDDTITLGAHTLDIDDDGGIEFKTDVKTPILRSYINSDLRLESETKGVYMYAANDISIRTLLGDINVFSNSDINLQSLNQAIILDAQNITVRGLPVTRPGSSDTKYSLVYQLCLCGNNGKLFLSETDGQCIATKEICS